MAGAHSLPVHVVSPVGLPDEYEYQWVETLRSALPKDHDVTIPDLFGCTASWLSILTGNSTDADLSPCEPERTVERKVMEETNHRETSSPGQDEREGQYEPNFRRNIFLKER